MINPFMGPLLLRAALVAFVVILSSCTSDPGGYKNRVVARVNEETLSAEDFADRLASRLKMFNDLTAKDSSVVAQAKSAIIQEFIVHVVTKEWAQANQIFVRKEQIESEVAKILKQYPDEISFRKALADEGLTYDKWEANLTQTLLERAVADVVRKKVSSPTDDELKAHYNSNKAIYMQPAGVRLKHIQLDNEAAAQKIRKEVLAGKSIDSLAKKYSQAPDANKGGDTGWLEKGFLEAFDTAFKMGVGQKSSIVKSPYGFHIFEVTAKRQAKTLSFEEVKAQIREQLIASKEQEVYQAWLEREVLKARVHKDDEFINSIRVQTRGLK